MIEKNDWQQPAKNEFHPVFDLIGQTLSDLGAHYEILILRFGEYEIHASCFARIVLNGEILLTTLDYQSWDEKDHRHNDMYISIAKHGEALLGQKVQTVEISPANDLFVTLDNNARIEIFSSNGKLQLTDEIEQWFFYKPKDKAYPYLSITNNCVETESKEYL